MKKPIGLPNHIEVTATATPANRPRRFNTQVNEVAALWLWRLRLAEEIAEDVITFV